eukprot:8023982-Pyramimonas_sp.AAC.1
MTRFVRPGRPSRVVGLPEEVRVDKAGGSRLIADASAMRLDVEPDCLHADVAGASPTSPMHRRC